jgi:DNA-binding PadR family transcriptional regulator
MSQVISQAIFQVLWLVSSRVGKTVGVPRGLLRFLVLKMLSEKPMSGAEIAEQIEKQTGGRWKPSPGSIYPLMAWMLDKGLTKESRKEGEGFKRYSFTVKGTEFLEKQIELQRDFLNKMEFLLPILIGGLPFGSSDEKLHGAIEPARQLVSALMAICHNLDELSQEDAEKIVQALNGCAAKLGKIAQRLRDEGKTQFVEI